MTTRTTLKFRGYIATLFAIAALSLSSIGCSNGSDSTSDQASVTTSTEFDGTSVTSAFQKTPSISASGTTCDSIHVTRARIIISAMKMHHDNSDSLGDGTIKVGPFIAEWDSTGQKIISTVTVPPGTYDRIKFEMHKLDDNKDASLLNDPLFGDFVNGGRYTAIIDGYAYVNGVAYAFSFKSSKTENVQVFLNPPATFSASNSYNLTLAFSPIIVFGRAGNRPLDPRDVDNKGDIEKFIKDALKALRK